jgi:hypothetical protein
MSNDQSADGTIKTNPRLIIGIVIVVLLAVAVVALAFSRETTRANGLLPLLATPTVPVELNDISVKTVTFSELNSDPLAYLNKPIQVSGEFLTLDKPACPRYSGPLLAWAVVAEGLQLEISGFERIVRILDQGTAMTVQGIWRLYQGPLGCGKGPSTGNTWYLQAQKIIQPNPLISSGSGNSLTIENVESTLPELLPTSTFTLTPTETPTTPPDTPTFTPTTEQIVPTAPVVATETPDAFLTASPTLTPANSTGTPEASTSTPGPSATPTLKPTLDSGDGGSQPTITSTPPEFPTATELPGGYPAPTDTPDPYT